ncbi:hypothetical protein HanPI659440_Chr03g0130271 [Helianthus annuus]|nr:hypothetical protein HanPI659440_Chr03g0130271 [Helianthus annuus]
MFILKLTIISQVLIHLNMHYLNLLLILQPIFTFTYIHKILNFYHKRLFLDFQNSRNATFQPGRSNKSIAHEYFVFNITIKTSSSHVIKLEISIFNWESNQFFFLTRL